MRRVLPKESQASNTLAEGHASMAIQATRKHNPDRWDVFNDGLFAGTVVCTPHGIFANPHGSTIQSITCLDWQDAFETVARLATNDAAPIDAGTVPLSYRRKSAHTLDYWQHTAHECAADNGTGECRLCGDTWEG